MTDLLILKEMYKNLTKGIIKNWYPSVIDKTHGGYFSNLSYNFELMPDQEKMIVTQSRHIWALAKFSRFFDNDKFKEYAFHGFRFLKDKMWDNEFGGFFTVTNREGNLTNYNGYFDEKRTYGNAFAIYGLAALYEVIPDEEILQLAKQTYLWLEEHAYDKTNNGYFQFLTREGKPFDKNSSYQTSAVDKSEVGLKDQNSSIHLLEAYTELFKVWKSPDLHKSLLNLLTLIRDVMVNKDGYLHLFFDIKLNPVLERDKPELNHVSFGHDYETAFLMLEASHSLDLENDVQTLKTAKKLIDHSIEFGWDKNYGGFFDAGLHIAKKKEFKIIKDTKVWWAQAEALNSLLLFSKIYPKEKKYYDLFVLEWDYIKKYLIDKKYGDWFWGSLEKEPLYQFKPKANIWKGTYHTGRALMNCIKMLSIDSGNSLINNNYFRKETDNQLKLINHWKDIAEKSC
jgi:mannobiose 2-epimerase